MSQEHCIYSFSEHSQTYRQWIKGLRGKRREVFKLAVARAAQAVADNWNKLSKDTRKSVLRKMVATNQKKRDQLEAAFEADFTKLYPDIKLRVHSNIDPEYVISILERPFVSKLEGELTALSSKLRTDTPVRPGRLTPCGVRIPENKSAKAALADPKLKAMLDEFTKGVSA